MSAFAIIRYAAVCRCSNDSLQKCAANVIWRDCIELKFVCEILYCYCIFVPNSFCSAHEFPVCERLL